MLDLPRVNLPADPAAAAENPRPDVLSSAEMAQLQAVHPDDGVDLHVALADSFAVGRCHGNDVVWRVGDAQLTDRLGHPAWLWTDDRCFEPDAADGHPAPMAHTLRDSLARLEVLGPRESTVGTLAAMVAAARARQPVALLVPPSTPSEPLRWLLLAFLTLLPPEMRARTHLATGEVDPRALPWTAIVVRGRSPDGFVGLRVDRPPRPSDPVAKWIRDRLLADDPERAEAGAFVSVPGADDPWAEGLARLAPPPVGGGRKAPEARAREAMRQLRDGADPAPVVDGLEETLPELDPALRVALWAELVTWLRDAGHTEAAIEAALSPVAVSIVAEGAAHLVTQLLLSIPGARHPALMRRIVGVLAGGRSVPPNLDVAMATLYRQLSEGSANDPEAELAVREVIDGWAQARAAAPHDSPDALVPALAGSSARLVAWAEAMARHLPVERLARVVGPYANDTNGRIWRVVEAAMPRVSDVQTRVARMGALLPAAGRALEATALESLRGRWVPRFPDRWLAETAAAFAELPDAHPLWMWIAAASAHPTQFDEEVIDATVVHFFESPPTAKADRDVAAVCADGLGLAAEHTPLEHARWVVRLLLAPDDGTDFGVRCATRLAQALATRPDAVPRLLEITTGLLDELEEDHPARLLWVDLLLPQAWRGGAPPAFTSALGGKLPPNALMRIRSGA